MHIGIAACIHACMHSVCYTVHSSGNSLDQSPILWYNIYRLDHCIFVYPPGVSNYAASVYRIPWWVCSLAYGLGPMHWSMNRAMFSHHVSSIWWLILFHRQFHVCPPYNIHLISTLRYGIIRGDSSKHIFTLCGGSMWNKIQVMWWERNSN